MTALAPSVTVPVDSRQFVVEVDRLSADEWSANLDLFDDANLYQTWAYGQESWGATNCSRLVLRCGEDVVAMAQARVVQLRPFKCGVAQVRWGPVCRRKGADLDTRVVQQVARALHAEFVRRRGLFLRVLPQAYQNTSFSQVMEAGFAQFRAEPFGPGDSYRTMLLDLSPPLEVLRKNLDQKWRNQLNRAEKNNLIIVDGDSPDDFRAFLPIYAEMHRRKQFDSSADVHAFEAVQRSLPRSQRLKVLRCELDGVAVAGLVGAGIGDTGVYLLGATSDTGLQAKGSYLLQWRMIQWLKERGVRYYNLGGINPVTNPGVYHFKKGFSGSDVLYQPALTACDSLASSLAARLASRPRSPLRNWVGRLLKRS